MFLRSALPLVLALAVSAAAQTVEVESAQVQPRFIIENASVADLSGLTWMGGDSFAAVSDKRNLIQLLKLHIDGRTGAITGGAFGNVADVPAKARDFEGIAWIASTKAFFLSAESGASVLRFVPGSAAARAVSVPGIFSKARLNLGIESLTWSAATRQFWIANEEALKPDGPVSGAEVGTLVRLQKLDAKFRPLAQYAWRTEPAAFRYGNAGSGVSDLCLLPDGQLIVLERGFGTSGLRLRLFLADFRGAADTSRVPSLAAAKVVPASKTPLFDEGTGFTNFEGLALGPPLADGWRSLIVLADSNGTATHTFLALRVRFTGNRARDLPPDRR